MTHWFKGGDDQRLAADLFGPDEGTPVLLIGGMGQTRHSWRRVAMRLADGGRRAITMDFRGHGESDRAPGGDYSYPRQVADIAAVARDVGRPMVLVGNSLGGKISLAAAGSGGADVAAALVMVDAVPRSRPDGIANVAQSMQVSTEGFASLDDAATQLAAARGQLAEPGAGDRLRRNMRQDDAGRWHWHWDAGYRDPRHRIGLGAGSGYLEALAPKVKVPALLAWCELSEVVDADGVAALRALIPQLEVEIIPGARHMIVGDQNDVFADAMMGFLARTGL
jgi:pimeloyl-ACP methyl ester carboxylesterase